MANYLDIGLNMSLAIDNIKKQVATENIVCYKKVKRLFRKDICLSDRHWHCYEKNIVQPLINFAYRKVGDIMTVFFGYSAWSEGWMNPNAKFMIPKGASYYYSEKFKEYMADRIVFLGWMDEEKK